MNFIRIAAWNVNHRAREKPISPKVSAAVKEAAADVLVLNEFVDGPSRSEFRDELTAIGLSHLVVSAPSRGQNQVLIASRFALEPGGLRGPSTPDGAGATNFLHVRLQHLDLDLIGVRVPWYTGESLRAYWEALKRTIELTRSQRVVWIGDMNADPERPTTVGGGQLAALKLSGWQIPAPSGPWSFPTGSRIDHALVAPSVRIGRAAYETTLHGRNMISQHEAEAASDHAMLLVEVQAR